MFQPETYTDRQLLQHYADIIDELKRRKIVRTENSPPGDYAKWLVTRKLSLTWSGKPGSGYDATDATESTRYLIKARRVRPTDPSPKFGVIRDLDEQKFDYLVAVIFNHDFSVQQAVRIPHRVLAEYADYTSRENGHALHMRGPILADTRVEDLTALLQT